MSNITMLKVTVLLFILAAASATQRSKRHSITNWLKASTGKFVNMTKRITEHAAKQVRVAGDQVLDEAANVGTAVGKKAEDVSGDVVKTVENTGGVVWKKAEAGITDFHKNLDFSQQGVNRLQNVDVGVDEKVKDFIKVIENKIEAACYVAVDKSEEAGEDVSLVIKDKSEEIIKQAINASRAAAATAANTGRKHAQEAHAQAKHAAKDVCKEKVMMALLTTIVG